MVPAATLARTRESLARAGGWLLHNDETHGFLSNHLAAAAAALYHIYRVTGDARFEGRSRYFQNRILERQSPEGWYDEYGGADPGYQTHGSFYLARLWQLSGDDALATSIERSMTFLAHFIHPDGSLGGEYTSRNTQTYYPAAFDMFASRHGGAAWISGRMRDSVPGAAAAGLPGVDAWNYFPLLNNIVFAYRAAASGAARAEPCEPDAAEGLLWYPGAGIARIRHARYDAYIGTAKGGVVKVWDRASRRLLLSDCGWAGRTFNGRVASTQYQDTKRNVRVDGGHVVVEGKLAQAARPVMSPLRFLAFRAFSLTVGRFAGAGRWLKQQLVRVLIYRKRTLDVAFQRTVELTANRIVIRDQLKGDHEGSLTSLERGALFTTIHMGSSRYFVNNDLDAVSASREPAEAWRIDPAQLSEGVTVERVLELN